MIFLVVLVMISWLQDSGYDDPRDRRTAAHRSRTVKIGLEHTASLAKYLDKQYASKLLFLCAFEFRWILTDASKLLAVTM